MGRAYQLTCSDYDLDGNKVIPERALVYAYLERAINDLYPVTSHAHHYRRMAIIWFKGKVKDTAFTFKEVIEELQLTEKTVNKIKGRVANAEYMALREEQEHESKQKREAYRVVRSELAEETRVPFSPENPTIQWNS